MQNDDKQLESCRQKILWAQNALTDGESGPYAGWPQEKLQEIIYQESKKVEKILPTPTRSRKKYGSTDLVPPQSLPSQVSTDLLLSDTGSGTLTISIDQLVYKVDFTERRLVSDKISARIACVAFDSLITHKKSCENFIKHIQRLGVFPEPTQLLKTHTELRSQLNDAIGQLSSIMMGSTGFSVPCGHGASVTVDGMARGHAKYNFRIKKQ